MVVPVVVVVHILALVLAFVLALVPVLALAQSCCYNGRNVALTVLTK